MAATFVNLETGRAVRIMAREESRALAAAYFPEIENKYKRQIEAYRVMTDEELFEVRPVRVKIPDEDLPGRPKRRVQCSRCGDWVQDGRDVERDGHIFCRACAFGGYYEELS